jgi:hypothetical protein
VTGWLQAVRSSFISEALEIDRVLQNLGGEDGNWKQDIVIWNSEFNELLQYEAFYYESRPPDIEGRLDKISQFMAPKEYLVFSYMTNFGLTSESIRIYVIIKDGVYSSNEEVLIAALLEEANLSHQMKLGEESNWPGVWHES